MPIFKKKSTRRFLGKSSKLWVLNKKSFLCNTQSLEHFPRNLHEDFFLKIGILSPKVYTKNRGAQALRALDPSHKVCRGLIWGSGALRGLTGACGNLFRVSAPYFGSRMLMMPYFGFRRLMGARGALVRLLLPYMGYRYLPMYIYYVLCK